VFFERGLAQSFEGGGLGFGPAQVSDRFYSSPVFGFFLGATGFDELLIRGDCCVGLLVEPPGEGEACEEVGAGFFVRLEGLFGGFEGLQGGGKVLEVDVAPACQAMRPFLFWELGLHAIEDVLCGGSQRRFCGRSVGGGGEILCRGIRRLALSDPTNTELQRDLGVSLNTVGDVYQAQGKLAEALVVFEESLTLFRRLALSDPTNTLWQNDLGVSLGKVGAVAEAKSDWALALKLYEEMLLIGQKILLQSPYSAVAKADVKWAISAVARVRAKLAEQAPGTPN